MKRVKIDLKKCNSECPYFGYDDGCTHLQQAHHDCYHPDKINMEIKEHLTNADDCIPPDCPLPEVVESEALLIACRDVSQKLWQIRKKMIMLKEKGNTDGVEVLGLELQEFIKRKITW